MTGLWLLRAASLLAPAGRRAGWMEEWRSELWYVPRREATRFCLGAFPDALWVRRQNPRNPLESPLGCLAMLAALAAASCVIVLWLPVPPYWHQPVVVHFRDLPMLCAPSLLFTPLVMPCIWLIMGGGASQRVGRLRRGPFLAAKLALIQPVISCSLLLALFVGRAVPFVPQLAVCAIILGLRWVITDQRRRCPVCLRLLTEPVRIGTPSHTFLEWYGGESMCSRGHGLMHIPEMEASYSARRRWLTLDSSWNSLFSRS